ncbi:two-component sensor histidine kinase [Desulfovibrio sp. OttesenSCG-928-A18]|nr:two-component sensor histidine kinase [Desulfovibrio sp. OttesenSCG-928-A18]
MAFGQNGRAKGEITAAHNNAVDRRPEAGAAPQHERSAARAAASAASARDEGGRQTAGHRPPMAAYPESGLRSFGFVRPLAWVALLLTIVLSIVVAFYLGNTASRVLMRKNQDFASLLADNLNNQIYRRFTLPTVSIFGNVSLRNPAQFKQLDQIIRSIIQDLQVQDLRIFSHDHTIAYSLNTSELGSREYASLSVQAATTSNGPIFDIDAKIPRWQSFFMFSLEPETFIMRTSYPLRFENRSSASGGGPTLGVLEFQQDITKDMGNAARFQQLVLAATLLGSGMLMAVLLLMVRRAERALAARVNEQQRLIHELHQHEKLAGMGRVVASIAHEIRNPLGIISSSAELLLKRSASSDALTGKILQAIYDEARRLSRTVSDFLDYARPRAPMQDEVDAAAVLDQALAFLTPEFADRDIGVVRAGILDSPACVLGDKDLLYRAFYNIMGNAIQAMGSSGTLTITLGRMEGEAPQITMEFQDSGPGFPKEAMDQLLVPFFTTKDDGTGLGLPIVNTIITSHGGTLTLANSPDGGAVARVALPAAPVPPRL